ncbi:hypothetical protein CEV08_06835 [Bartonella tribocorum]|uniref:Uncharacterized protein n=1 Tax=Bartonella tribocorum TaxID=85701 RepID=A0A2M6USH7_9HYPH|nr:hypothetical protein CEV08_06835 [Bartonella tribocorum]
MRGGERILGRTSLVSEMQVGMKRSVWIERRVGAAGFLRMWGTRRGCVDWNEECGGMEEGENMYG